MFLDAVLTNNPRTVMFNGTPEDTREYLLKLDQAVADTYWVVPGRTLEWLRVREYLNIQN